MNRIITVTLNPAIDQTLSIPNFKAGQVNRVASEEMNAGGKGVNVAAVLADLGAKVVVTGVLGDQNAELFEALFRGKQIEDQFVRCHGKTRIGVKITDPISGQTTDINFSGRCAPGSAVDEVSRRLDAFVLPGTWVVLAGSVPGGANPAIYGNLIDLVNTRGGRAALDTSGEPLRYAVKRKPAFIKPNADELGEFLGRKLETFADRLAATKQLIVECGLHTAALSMGGDGAIFVNADEAILARPPSVKVVSTVGAGDAMVAGAVFALSRGDSLDDVARLATALGSDAVTRVGAGIDAARSFEALIERVVLEPLD